MWFNKAIYEPRVFYQLGESGQLKLPSREESGYELRNHGNDRDEWSLYVDGRKHGESFRLRESDSCMNAPYSRGMPIAVASAPILFPDENEVRDRQNARPSAVDMMAALANMTATLSIDEDEVSDKEKASGGTPPLGEVMAGYENTAKTSLAGTGEFDTLRQLWPSSRVE